MWDCINIIVAATSYNGCFLEKWQVFSTLLRLKIKSILPGNNKMEVCQSIFRYQFRGYQYETINYLFKEIFLSDDYFFRPDNESPTIIDCGANIGMSILYFKKNYPNANIIAFEANPQAYHLLTKNIKENGLKNVELYNTALYDQDAEISFFINKHPGTLIASINKTRAGAIETKIKATKLSDYLKNMDSIDLIKMDVEGAENNIIKDLFETSTIGKAKEYIIEYHHNIKSEKSDLSNFLKKFEESGFNYNLRGDFNNLGSFQDIIIHFFKRP